MRLRHSDFQKLNPVPVSVARKLDDLKRQLAELEPLARAASVPLVKELRVEVPREIRVEVPVEKIVTREIIKEVVKEVPAKPPTLITQQSGFVFNFGRNSLGQIDEALVKRAEGHGETVFKFKVLRDDTGNFRIAASKTVTKEI